MIILLNALLGCEHIIVFQLAERIAIETSFMMEKILYSANMIRFAYCAIPSRHEVPEKPRPNEQKRKLKTDKTNEISGAAKYILGISR